MQNDKIAHVQKSQHSINWREPSFLLNSSAHKSLLSCIGLVDMID